MRDIEIKKFGNPMKGVNGGIKAGNIRIAADVTTQTKLLAPVDLGQLKNSYMWKVPTEEGGFNEDGGEKAADKISVSPKEFEAYVGSAVLHAIYQEFGTSKAKPQPHFRPAIDLVVKRTSTQQVLAKIQEEEMRRPLKEGVSRVQF